MMAGPRAQSLAARLGTAVVAGTVLAGAVSPSAEAQSTPTPQPTISRQQCAVIGETVIDVVRRAGSQTLSDDFKRSVRAFLGPSVNCDGPREILIAAGRDSDVWNTIQDLLESSRRNPIVLARLGVRGVVRSAGLGDVRRTPVSVGPK